MSSPTTDAAIGQQTTGRSHDGRDPAVSPLRGMTSPLARQSEHAVEHFISPLTARAQSAAHKMHESFFVVVGQKIECKLCGVDSIGHDVELHAGMKRHRIALDQLWRPPRSPHSLTLQQIISSGIPEQLQLQKKAAETKRKRLQTNKKRKVESRVAGRGECAM